MVPAYPRSWVSGSLHTLRYVKSLGRTRHGYEGAIGYCCTSIPGRRRRRRAQSQVPGLGLCCQVDHAFGVGRHFFDKSKPRVRAFRTEKHLLSRYRIIDVAELY